MHFSAIGFHGELVIQLTFIINPFSFVAFSPRQLPLGDLLDAFRRWVTADAKSAAVIFLRFSLPVVLFKRESLSFHSFDRPSRGVRKTKKSIVVAERKGKVILTDGIFITGLDWTKDSLNE
jgi:hypothetical protein